MDGAGQQETHMAITATRLGLAGAVLLGTAALVSAHGDVAPQPVDTGTLPEVGEEWLLENPYRGMGDDVMAEAIEIGASGYSQNCARCHGLGAVSGGLAPDLRYLEAEEYGDEWYAERFRNGYTQGGATKMPAFEEVLTQEAAWAIRTYVETRPDDAAVTAASGDLKAIRDELQAAAGGGALDEAVTKARLEEIAGGIETLSGSPMSDSVAHRAAALLDGTSASYERAAEVLTVGLSAAQ
jgi:cytochrome c-550 PedF